MEGLVDIGEAAFFLGPLSSWKYQIGNRSCLRHDILADNKELWLPEQLSHPR